MASENALFPVEESPEFIQESEDRDNQYRYTVAWDVEKEISYWTVKTEWKPVTVWKVTKCGAAKWLSHRDMPALHIRMK